ncbi:MAG: DUF882 domain-containing protein [bacterium]
MRKRLPLLVSFALLLLPSGVFAHPDFFIMGSGEINLQNVNKGGSVKIRYRKGEKDYDVTALKKINQVYGSSYDDPVNRMSLRFLELLSYLQDHFNGAQIQILSGFRSSSVNQGLRNQGKMAAQSSMHIEASAADIRLEGVEITKVKDYAMELPCCGVGYYHGRHIHLDTGPKRWWDEKTSGTEKKEPQENEKIILLTKKDIYSPGEAVDFDFARASDFPIGVPSAMSLEKQEKDQWKKIDEGEIAFADKKSSQETCVKLGERRQIKNLSFKPKKSLAPGRYRISVTFCEKQWTKMPDSILSNEFEVRPE